MVQRYLSCSVDTAAHEVFDSIVNGSLSGECVENYTLSSKEGKCVVMVLEKHFMRTSSRASLTVTVDNLSGKTRLTAVGSGGGTGVLFGFDWGAGGNLEDSALKAVSEYIV